MGIIDLTEKILCDVAERLENRGRMEGLREGRNEGLLILSMYWYSKGNSA